MSNQLTIDWLPETLLSGPWKKEALAQQSADMWRDLGIEVEVVEREKGWTVEAP